MLSFSIKDIIDILLVAMLLYYIYRIMKKSRSGNIFVGIIIFIIVWIFVSKVFNMRLLGSIMDKAINLGAIALVVIFQEDIRNFFSTLGTQRSFIKLRKLFGRQHAEEEDNAKSIIPVVAACNKMSKNKVGALIVYERYVRLGNIEESGEIINADIKSRLIENIFFKNSPLHDGAMLIYKNRIRAAGCILNLSLDKKNIPENMGLRHRAAIGVTQKSDAVAVVVSEETGAISLAFNGKIYADITAKKLEAMLTKILR